MNIGEYQKAVEEYTTYIGLRPEEPAGYHNRASAYKHLKNMAAYQKDKVPERQLLFKRSEDEAD